MKIHDITKISLCVALLCVTSYLVCPLPFTPIVISFQTVIVNMIGLILKPKEATFTMVVYLLMGLIGLPVFSAGTSGPGKLFGPTGGFYLGFLFATILISLLKGKKCLLSRYCAITIVVGIPVQHFCGIILMCIHNGWNISAAFLTVSVPFLLVDILKCVMASVLAVALNKVLK